MLLHTVMQEWVAHAPVSPLTASLGVGQIQNHLERALYDTATSSWDLMKMSFSCL